MFVFFVLFFIIDLVIAYVFFREAFVVRSNMTHKYKIRLALLASVMGGSVLLFKSNLPVACLLAGLPAGLAILFFAGMFIAAMTHKGKWN